MTFLLACRFAQWVALQIRNQGAMDHIDYPASPISA